MQLAVLIGLTIACGLNFKLDNMNNKTKGYLSIIASVFCFAIIETTGTLIYKGGANPLTLLTIRFLLASLLFLATYFIFKRFSLKIKKEDIWKIVLSSGILVIHLMSFWWGLKTLNHIATSLAIFFTFPLWVMILSSLFLKEKFGRIRIASLGIGILGVLFAIKFLPQLSVSSMNVRGISFMLLAAISWAFYMIVKYELMKKYHWMTILFYNFAIASIAFLILQNPITTFNQLTPAIFGYIVLMAIVSTYIAYLLFHVAIKKIKASNTAIVNLLKPIFSIGLASLILSQKVNSIQIIGIILLLFSNYLLIKDNG